MAVACVPAARKRCPECKSRRIRRSKRSEQERRLYPQGKFYRCEKCGTRFVRPEGWVEDMAVDDSGLYEPKKLWGSRGSRREDKHRGIAYVLFLFGCVALFVLLACLLG